MNHFTLYLTLFIVCFFGGWLGQSGLIPFPGMNVTQLRLGRTENRLEAIEEKLETLQVGTVGRAGAVSSETDRDAQGDVSSAAPAQPAVDPALEARAAQEEQILTSTDGREIAVMILEVGSQGVRAKRTADGFEVNIPFELLVEKDREFLEYVGSKQAATPTESENPYENIDLEELFGN